MNSEMKYKFQRVMRGRKLAGRKLRFELEFISGVSLKEVKYKAKTRKPWKWPRPPTVKLIIILTMEGFFFAHKIHKILLKGSS